MPNDHDRPDADTKTVVQINIYRCSKGLFEYLLLKRIDEDKDFWQPVTKPVPAHGTIAESLRQAAKEQVGIRGFKSLNDETYSYEWYSHGERGRDLVFAAEVSSNAPIQIDQDQYVESAWMTYKQALASLKWNGNKEALRRLDDKLVDEYTRHPGHFQNVEKSEHGGPLTQPEETQDAGSLAPPSQTGRQKRLPDPPAMLPRRESDEPNIAEFFLKM